MSLINALIEASGTALIAAVALPWLSPERRRDRIVVAAIGIGLIVRYLVWRGLYTVPWSEIGGAALIQWTYFAAECCVLYLAVRYLLLITRNRNRSGEATRNAPWLAALPRPPRVDILLPTYNEEPALLERTIIGILGLDYPNARLWVLDDGARPWLAALCRRRGVEYLARSLRDHGKAGNLNHALRHIAAQGDVPDFIAVFDADFIPTRRFLGRVLPLFRDARIALVQTPQYFFNDGPFQHNFRAEHVWPEEMLNLFDVGFPARDARGTVNCSGTSFVIRWQALESIGFFPTETVVEDLLATLKLRAKGWEIAYLHEALSAGLAATGLAEYISQHRRWYLGALQVFFGSCGFFSRCALPWRDRLNLLDHFAFWGILIPFNLAKLAVPLLYWTTGIFIMRVDLASFIAFFVPLAIVLTSATSWVSRGRYMPFADRVSQILIGFGCIGAVLTGLFRRGRVPFEVTDKCLVRERMIVHRPLLTRLIIVATVSMESAVLALWSGGTDLLLRDQTIIVLAMMAGDAFVLLVAALACIERPQLRREPRFVLSEAAEIRIGDRRHSATVSTLSTSAATLRCTAPLSVGAIVSLKLEQVGEMEATVQRIQSDGIVVALHAGSDRDALVRKVYSGRYYRRASSYRSWPVLIAIASYARDLTAGMFHGRHPYRQSARAMQDHLDLAVTGHSSRTRREGI